MKHWLQTLFTAATFLIFLIYIYIFFFGGGGHFLVNWLLVFFSVPVFFNYFILPVSLIQSDNTKKKKKNSENCISMYERTFSIAVSIMRLSLLSMEKKKYTAVVVTTCERVCVCICRDPLIFLVFCSVCDTSWCQPVCCRGRLCNKTLQPDYITLTRLSLLLSVFHVLV